MISLSIPYSAIGFTDSVGKDVAICKNPHEVVSSLHFYTFIVLVKNLLEPAIRKLRRNCFSLNTVKNNFS